jgi:Holliday junction resolvase
MALTNRQRGDYFERTTRDALTKYGWYVVRAGGSLGIADLVALRAGSKPLLVSCKTNGRIDPAEREALHTTARAAGARPLVASRPKGGHVLLRCVRWDSPTAVTVLEVVDTLRAPSRKRADHAESEASSMANLG